MRKRLLHHLCQWTLVVGLVAPVGRDLLADGAALPGFAPGEYAFVRTLRTVSGKEKWRMAPDLATRLAVWRSEVNAFRPGQNPISERYVVCAYGGVIDMRHFLYTACKVLTNPGDKEYWKGLSRPIDGRYTKYRYQNPFGRKYPGIDYQIQLALYDTYCVERGREYQMAKRFEKADVLDTMIRGQYWAATPEDLPSSALGAEFARQLLKLRDPLLIDVEAEFCRFLAPFKPAPDKLREKLAHSELVYGIPAGSEKEIPLEKLVWFRAEPANCTKLLKAKAAEVGMDGFCEEVADGNAALAKAGYKVANVAGGLPLRIVPVK